MDLEELKHALRRQLDVLENRSRPFLQKKVRPLLRRLAFKGVTPVVLLTGVLVVEGVVAAVGFTTRTIPSPLGEAPASDEALVAAAPSATPSAAAEAATPSPSPAAAGPVRTAAPPVAAAPPCGDGKTHRVSGRVVLNDGSPVYNAAVEFYRATDGSYLSTFRTDGSGGYVGLVVGGTYKVHFIPSIAASSTWWNARQNLATATVVFACTGDVGGVNAVLTKF